MFKPNDPNTYTQFYALYSGATQIGYMKADYQVARYDNVQVQNLNSVTQAKNRQFIVHCSQRMVIYNIDGLQVDAAENLSGYQNYPALINTNIGLTGVNGPDGVEVRVLDYSPKTINTKVQSSGSNGQSNGQMSGTSSGSTVGSSTSQSNSYGASANVGFPLSFGVSGSYDNTSTSGTESSVSNGINSSVNKNSDSSSTDSMSMKDWGSYGFVDPLTNNPYWVFGQEYPWDAVQCRTLVSPETPNPDEVNAQASGADDDPSYAQYQLILPSEMLVRLYDQVCLYPPSQLSMFGVNFISKVSWVVALDNATSDVVTVSHAIDFYTASHLLNAVPDSSPVTYEVGVYIDIQPTVLNGGSGESLSIDINLPLIALDVLGQPKKQAIIGFIPNKFTVLPVASTTSTAATPFEIVATSNTLLIMDTTSPAATGGAGFTAGETALTAGFSSTTVALSMTAYFKVTDTSNDYALFLKHWMAPGSTTGIMLTFIINGDTSNPITKYVTSLEGEGGEGNLLTISLRNQNFASVEYHDYLQLGLNAVQITIAPVGGAYVADCGYQIRAISIERN